MRNPNMKIAPLKSERKRRMFYRQRIKFSEALSAKTFRIIGYIQYAGKGLWKRMPEEGNILTATVFAGTLTRHKSPLFHQESQVRGTFGTRHELELNFNPRGTTATDFNPREEPLGFYSQERGECSVWDFKSDNSPDFLFEGQKTAERDRKVGPSLGSAKTNCDFWHRGLEDFLSAGFFIQLKIGPICMPLLRCPSGKCSINT